MFCRDAPQTVGMISVVTTKVGKGIGGNGVVLDNVGSGHGIRGGMCTLGLG